MDIRNLARSWVPALLLCGLIGAGCNTAPPTANAPADPATQAANGNAIDENATAGNTERPNAPEFSLTTVGGEKFALSEQKGKHPVLINFFATW